VSLKFRDHVGYRPGGQALSLTNVCGDLLDLIGRRIEAAHGDLR
jgi:hypothetical protein